MLEHRVAGVIAPDHPCLPGHFPGQPVVPAVVLLDFAARALAGALGRPARLTAVPAAKFLAPLLPGQPFTVTLSVDAAAGSARFVVASPSQELASGRLEFTADARSDA
jgi:3-hydroxymyristoyl/3-hydroxydecanoyl-(acyl carrier protein) dehydratase